MIHIQFTSKLAEDFYTKSEPETKKKFNLYSVIDMLTASGVFVIKFSHPLHPLFKALRRHDVIIQLV